MFEKFFFFRISFCGLFQQPIFLTKTILFILGKLLINMTEEIGNVMMIKAYVGKQAVDFTIQWGINLCCSCLNLTFLFSFLEIFVFVCFFTRANPAQVLRTGDGLAFEQTEPEIIIKTIIDIKSLTYQDVGKILFMAIIGNMSLFLVCDQFCFYILTYRSECGCRR